MFAVALKALSILVVPLALGAALYAAASKALRMRDDSIRRVVDRQRRLAFLAAASTEELLTELSKRDLK
jgi:hypothetical protein